MCFGLMSVSKYANSDVSDCNNSQTVLTCCNAYITYMGEVQQVVTRCSSGFGSFAFAAACANAARDAQAIVDFNNANGIVP